MASFSFLHAADIHLDSPLVGLSRYDGVPADQVRRAPRAAFDRLIAAAIERRVDFVVIAGDLYDGDWRDVGTGLYFAACMGRLARAGIPVYLLAGNHDAVSIISRELPHFDDNVRGFDHRKPDTHRIEHLNVALHGQSFAERQARDNLAAHYPRAVEGAFNIGVLHTSLAGGYHGHETYAPCTAQDLIARGYDYWALGHVHEHLVVSDTRPHIVFPGNIQGRNMREQGPRGAMLVEVRDGEVASLTRLELDVVRWASVAVKLGEAPDVAAVHARVGQALAQARNTLAGDRPLVVRLTLAGATVVHGALQASGSRLRDEIRAVAAGVGGDIWIEKIVIQTSDAAGTAARAAADENGAIFSLIPAPNSALAGRLHHGVHPLPGHRQAR